MRNSAMESMTSKCYAIIVNANVLFLIIVERKRRREKKDLDEVTPDEFLQGDCEDEEQGKTCLSHYIMILYYLQ